jgi:hypothetical protein
LIPAFEGQPLEESVDLQIKAAGGEIVNDQARAQCVIYVNNFAEKNTFPPVQNVISGAQPNRSKSFWKPRASKVWAKKL